MKKLILSCVFLLCCAGVSLAQSCDCTICPYSPNPPCFNLCVVHLLATTSLDDLIRVVGLREDTARRIVTWPKRNTVKSLEDYQEILPQEDLKAIGDRANSLSPLQLKNLYRDQGRARDIRMPMPLVDPAILDKRSPQIRASRDTESGETSGRISMEGSSSRVLSVSGDDEPVRIALSPAHSRRLSATHDMSELSYSYYRDGKRQWRWRLRSANGETLATSSQGYKYKQDCLAAIDRVKASSTAKVVKD